MTRVRIVVSIRRFEQPCYTYDYARQPVKPSKASRILAEAVDDTARAITRDFKHRADIRDFERGSSIRSGDIRASVRMVTAKGRP